MLNCHRKHVMCVIGDGRGSRARLVPDRGMQAVAFPAHSVAIRPAARVRPSDTARAPLASSRSSFVVTNRQPILPDSRNSRGSRGHRSLSVRAAAAPVAAMSTLGATALQFTPLDALCGGAILGVAAIAKLMLTGRLLGVSASVKRPAQGEFFSWDFAFLGGLLAAGAFHVATAGPLPAEPMVGVGRALLAGSLVGGGSAMGNGCTSGHGICGNARLSPRSMAYTGVFMLVGFIAATVFDTAGALNIASASAINSTTIPSLATLSVWAAFAAASVGAFIGLGALATSGKAAGGAAYATDELSGGLVSGMQSKLKPPWQPTIGPRKRLVNVVADGLVGFVFGTGLIISGMTRPVKVAGFLSALHPAWDPSLALVMGGALALCAPGFYFIQKYQKAPVCSLEFGFSSNSKLDKRLMAGGVMFGAGWGLGGICPGPSIVALAMVPSPAIFAWVGGMVPGMVVNKNLLSTRQQSSLSAASL